MIKVIFLDIDNTLINFHACARSSMKYSLAEYGVEFKDDMFDTFTEINNSLWLKIEKGTLTKEGLYKIRWNMIFEKLGIDIDGQKFEKLFISHLNDCVEPVEYANELLEYLFGKYTLYAASNAPHLQQLRRLEKAGMLKYIKDVFTSEKLGYQKPSKEFFDECFKKIEGVPRDEVMIIGDSLTADISGGIEYGIKTCWFNEGNLPPSKNTVPDYTVNSLSEIKNIL